jgi:hypothetical protein
MQEITLNNFQELHERFQTYDPMYAIFRGVTKSEYQLVPSIGRIKLKREQKLNKVEKRMLRTFKERSVLFVESTPKDEWEWLALAQHHGLPTRLLDWTRNSLVALYFAVRKKHNGDSAVYVLKSSERAIDTNEFKNPLNMGGLTWRYIPSHVTSRLIAQSGLFTFHPEPLSPYVSNDLDKLIIPADSRKQLKQELYRYGIHEASMFPGLDGLSSHITWMNEEKY